MSERTLILIKPDGVQRGLIGRIVDRYEERGLRIVGMKLMVADRALAERHYEVHREKPFFGGLIEFITSGPLVAMAVEGPNAIAVCRVSMAPRNRSTRHRAASAATGRSRPDTTWSMARTRRRTRPASSPCGSSPRSCSTTTRRSSRLDWVTQAPVDPSTD